MDIIFLRLVLDVGFPIAAAIAAGYFVFLTLQFILAGVTSSVKGMSVIISTLEERISTMNTEILQIDIKVSQSLDLPPDLDRVARSEQSDTRID